MNIFDSIFGNCKNDIHIFKEFLIKSTPPNDISRMRGADANEVINVIDSLTKKEYEIRCKYCGKKAE